MDYTFKSLAAPLLNLLYPSLCLYCQTALKERGPLFCSTCLDQISLIETQERCRTCFAEFHKDRCERCIHRRIVIHRQLAACEAIGPASFLLGALRDGRKEGISAAASLMAYQWLKQKFLLPEYLIPMPVSFWQKQKSGFDTHLQLANELGKIFSIPVLPILKKRFDHSTFLTQGEFTYKLEVKANKGSVLCDRRILLIAPQLDDALLRSAGKELKVFFPGQIEALAFAGNL